ncbi:Hsp20/alpha crystallin family protein [Segetibacter sp. 3557_3]|uniref:Hsp20/alpha crystallin family protein n=1 Tax=Segetibacter sp. 3557_3 TaxID=2547429 RepID=UPI0010585E1F|nr:Hsp20/alpha crystallin family protein [Segetibacter sp. 3557_3]TDH28916.1 Hsp20/alpha crystallin family protein [Segetibacter sp. 3557_3]
MILTKSYPANKGLNNVFDEFFGTFPQTFTKTIHNGITPAVNIFESEEAYHLELNAPGRNKEDFKLNLDKGLLTISFEQKSEAENNGLKTVRKEFSFASFKRSFTIDDKINTEAIQAKYESGILKIYLPKKEEVKAAPQQIQIQ